MGRYTSAYSSFVNRLAEVDTLRRFAASKERTDPVGMRNEINALCRGALVLLCSHMEAYIEELGQVALESLYSKAVPRGNLPSKFFYHVSKEFFDDLKDTTDAEKLGEKLFHFIQNEADLWSRVGAFPRSVPDEKFNKGFSSPSYKKVKSYFNRFGYTDYKSDLASELAADFQATTNMVDHLIDTRNKIAHGDPSATKTPGEVKDITLIIKRYCATTDLVFAKWWKLSYCGIR